MAWIDGIAEPVLRDYNEELALIKGELTEEQAQIFLCKYLRHNLRITTHQLTGIILAPCQSLVLKALFEKSFSMLIWSRGAGKSTLAGIFASLYAIFNPGTKIIVVSSNFRSARRMLENIEKMAEAKPNLPFNPGGVLLKQTFKKPLSRKNDLFVQLFLNQSEIMALPLSNGENIRGMRADLLIVDEALLVPQNIVDSVLKPFLAANSDAGERIRIKKLEDHLIAKGVMKESERKKFVSNKKMILLSSASYQFEPLYDVYRHYLKTINTNKDDAAGYFVSQFGYEVFPKEILAEEVLNDVSSGNTPESIVLREYKAQFISDAKSYFSLKKMMSCSILDGQDPTIEIRGEAGAKYVLGIDSSFSSSSAADAFAMSLIKIVTVKNGEERGMLVHSYAVAGGELKDHFMYFYYLLTNFNIVYIISDTSTGGGFDFINAATESKLFKDNSLVVKGMDINATNQNLEELYKEVAEKHKPMEHKIVHRQPFQGMTRTMNEYLQSSINSERILFAARACAHPSAIQQMSTVDLGKIRENGQFQHAAFVDEEGTYSMYDFIEQQDTLLERTRKEIASVEVKVNSLGTMTFALPESVRRLKSENRPRKDLYSSFLLANWGLRCYMESNRVPKQKYQSGFVPFFAV